MTAPTLALLTACVTCGGNVRKDVRDLAYERGGVLIVVADVPVLVCDECDEAFVAGELGLQLGDIVEDYFSLLERRAAQPPIVALPRSLRLALAE